MPGAEAFELEPLLESSGALLRGHFLLSSGRHSDGYVQCARLLEMPGRAARVGRELAARLRPYEPRVIVSPALGGLIIGHEVAASLDLPFRFCEREEGRMVFRRGFRLAPGDSAVIVEDVVTTGKSTGEAASAVAAAGGRVVAVGAIIDRTGGENPFQVPFEALTRVELESWAAEACPLCAGGSRPEKPGSREQPLESRAGDDAQPRASR